MTLSDEPSLRRFERRDAPAVAKLFRAAVLAIDRRLYSTPQLGAWAARADPSKLEERCAQAMTWVAEIDGELAAFMACELDGHVDLAYVHPEHQRRGLARALHAQVQNEARRLRLGRLFTEASEAARPFFERAGFAATERQSVRVGEQLLHNWKMDARLANLDDAERVFVIGNSGSGKTTLAKQLGLRLARPHLQLDAVAFADQAGTRRSIGDSSELLTQQAGCAERPVIDGCYADLVAALARPGDHLIWLDLPVETCVAAARARPWEPDKWPSAEAHDDFLPQLIAFIEGYPQDPTPTGRPGHARLFAEFPGMREAHRDRPPPESLRAQ